MAAEEEIMGEAEEWEELILGQPLAQAAIRQMAQSPTMAQFD
jgi:hypothetical protein